jgi:hypothetical protein
MVAKITLNNNQYPRDWFKTHYVTTKVKKIDTFRGTTHV